MTLIYDFDGTLTRFNLPQYAIIEKFISLDEYYNRVFKNETDVYKGFVEEYLKILHSNNAKATKENICYGADKVSFNVGVEFFLEHFFNQGVQHFVVTSGFEEYVRKTKIVPYLTDIIGTTLDENENINRLMTDSKKVEAIASIIKRYEVKPEEIIYFGDGLTDMQAFDYVKKIGGRTILVYNPNSEKDKETLTNLSSLNLIDQAFPKDFSMDSDLFKFISSLGLTR